MKKFFPLSYFLLILFRLGFAQVEIQPITFEIADKLRCPVCISESVAESSSKTSVEMRNLIQSMLNEGKNEAEILSYFQERYGDWILLTPPRRGYYLVVWIAPIVMSLLILTVVLLAVRRWSKRSTEPVEVATAYLHAAKQLTDPGKEIY